MHGFDAVAMPRQAAGDLFGNHHGAVLAASAAERQSEVALAFVDVVREQKEQQFGDPIEKLPGLRKTDDVILNLWIFSGQISKFRNEVGVGQESHIEDQIRVERDALLVPEADGGDDQALAIALAHEFVLDVSAQLVDVEPGGVNDDVRDLADRLQKMAFFLQSTRYTRLAAERVRAARLRVSGKQCGS